MTFLQESIFRKKATLIFLVTLASGCVAHIPEPVDPNPKESSFGVVQRDPAGSQKIETQKVETSEKAPGMTVYINPKTGELTTRPSEVLPTVRRQQPLTSGADSGSELHEILSPVPGGGVAIRLGDQYLTPLTGTIDADGKLRLEHLKAQPDSANKK
jgi:hypothetical protein